MRYKINLLSLDKEKPLDRMIYFALNYLRYILVITQIVVIAVFFYRFKVDQEIVDLQDTISQKKEIIDVSQPLLKEAKNISLRLGQVDSILHDQNMFLGSLDYVLSLFPEKFNLTQLNISEITISMAGVTQDLPTIKSFLNKLKKEGRFGSAELTNINKTEEGFEFSFELSKFKDAKKSL